MLFSFVFYVKDKILGRLGADVFESRLAASAFAAGLLHGEFDFKCQDKGLTVDCLLSKCVTFATTVKIALVVLVILVLVSLINKDTFIYSFVLSDWSYLALVNIFLLMIEERSTSIFRFSVQWSYSSFFF